MKTINFNVSITFSDKITDDQTILEIAAALANGIKNEVESRGIVPDYADTYTESIKVKPQFYDEEITIKIVE